MLYRYIVRDFGVFIFVLFKQVHVFKYRIKLQNYVYYKQLCVFLKPPFTDFYNSILQEQMHDKLKQFFR